MKFTLLEPCDDKFYHSEVSGPLGLAYIASYLDKELDNSVDTSIETDFEYVLKTKPDIVGISAYTQNFSRALSAAKKIKEELNIPIVLGGKHITVLPETLQQYFDVGVVGDGERTMSDLMKLYIEKKQFLPEDLINIKGVAFRDENKIYTTPQRDALKDLDMLPPPKRNIMNAYSPITQKRRVWHQGLYTSRGCPYKCPFCIHSKIQFVSRYHSPERVVSEVEEIVSKFPGQKVISIYDDLFIVSKKRLEALKNLIVSEKLNKKVSFTAMCKTNHFDEDIAIMLREMNVRFVAFGLESADEKTLQYLKKDSSKVSEHLESINLCNKYGIENGGYFILGAPPENVEALSKTYWFINSNKPPMKFVSVLFLTPLPGTKEWDNASEKGFVDPFNENWDLYNYQNHDVTEKAFNNEHYSFEFLKASYDEWFAPLFANITSLKHSPEETKLFHTRLFDEIKDLNISNENSILEIGTYFNYTFKDLMPENKNITIFDHRNYLFSKEKQLEEEKVLIDKKFDYIIFNFSLEQMVNPYEKLKLFVENNLAEKGKVIIFTKNPQFVSNFFNLLSKNFDGMRKSENPNDFVSVEINKLKKVLSKELLLNVEEKSLVGDTRPYINFYRNIAPILIQKSTSFRDYIDKSTIANYIFIAGKK